jgi:hypothetical protein
MAGVLGATGGYFAKLGFDPASAAVPFLTDAYLCNAPYNSSGLSPVCEYAGLVIRGALVVMSFASSGAGIASFVMAMETASSVAVTVLSTGSNIICSGSYAILMDETITPTYCTGSALIVAGMALIAYSEKPGPTVTAASRSPFKGDLT